MEIKRNKLSRQKKERMKDRKEFEFTFEKLSKSFSYDVQIY